MGNNHITAMTTNIKEIRIEGAMVGNIPVEMVLTITVMVVSEIKIVGITNGISIVEILTAETPTCSLREVTLGVIFDPLYILPPHLLLHQCLCQCGLLATI